MRYQEIEHKYMEHHLFPAVCDSVEHKHDFFYASYFHPPSSSFLSYQFNDAIFLGFTQRVARFSGAVPIDRGSAPDEVPNEPEVPISLFSVSHARSDTTAVDDSESGFNCSTPTKSN
jgi:hypothetical protein